MNRVSEIRLRFWLARTARRPVADDVLCRLELADGPLWASVRKALRDAHQYYDERPIESRQARVR